MFFVCNFVCNLNCPCTFQWLIWRHEIFQDSLNLKELENVLKHVTNRNRKSPFCWFGTSSIGKSHPEFLEIRKEKSSMANYEAFFLIKSWTQLRTDEYSLLMHSRTVLTLSWIILTKLSNLTVCRNYFHWIFVQYWGLYCMMTTECVRRFRLFLNVMRNDWVWYAPENT